MNMDELSKNALLYHSGHGGYGGERPGKIGMVSTKRLDSQNDLSLAYTPGVAVPCLKIYENPDEVYKYTARGNTVAVISNGTAVLGLGDIGAAASKPVMEGKAVLFKKFADIDCVDIEVDTKDVDEFINVVRYLGKTWGGINLEDIKSPDCFVIEERLNKLVDIPVFHDDQHGTAIVVCAGIINAAYLTDRKISEMKIVVSGAGAAAIACINMLVLLGARRDNIIACDSIGVIYHGREDGMNSWKDKIAVNTPHRLISEALVGADMFIGVSAKNAISPTSLKDMAPNPIIFALANPDPEVTPHEALAVRSDAIVATGRSDYKNQVNNVLAFPYVFRGALDVRASEINEAMKLAAAEAIALLAREPVANEVYEALGLEVGSLKFSREYLLPSIFDPRLIKKVSTAVAQAAIDSGVARIKIDIN